MSIALLVALASLAAATTAASSAHEGSALRTLDIYSIRVDATGRQRLTASVTSEHNAAVSYDGRWIGFARDREVRGFEQDLWLIDLRSRRSRLVGEITADYYFTGPVWSPVRNRVAFTYVARSTCGWGSTCIPPEIRVADVAKPGFRVLRAGSLNAAWSPDGRWLAAMRGWRSPEGAGIEVFDHSGGRVRRVEGEGGADPSWSPDGKVIAYARGDGWSTDGQITVVAASGTGPQRVLGVGVRPLWSPRGRRLLAERITGPAGSSGVYRLEGGRRARRLVRDGGGPSWSPDGQRVAFVRFVRQRSELWVMRADGSRQRRLTRAIVIGGPAAWSPDGSRLFYTAAY
jgi:Tol biopolymer transport system component